jgi:hypothetical protein
MKRWSSLGLKGKIVRVVEDILKSEEVFDDIEELGALCRCGEVYPVRIIAHWLGLKLAVAQLEAVGVA